MLFSLQAPKIESVGVYHVLWNAANINVLEGIMHDANVCMFGMSVLLE